VITAWKNIFFYNFLQCLNKDFYCLRNFLVCKYSSFKCYRELRLKDTRIETISGRGGGGSFSGLMELAEGSALLEGLRNVDLHAVGNLYLELHAVNVQGVVFPT
jgi:hypothetical protein